MIGPKIKAACDVAYACGLKTLGEAITNFDIHFRSLLTPEQDKAEVEALNAELQGEDMSQLVTDILGPEHCAKIDQEFDEWSASFQPDSAPAEEFEAI